MQSRAGHCSHRYKERCQCSDKKEQTYLKNIGTIYKRTNVEQQYLVENVGMRSKSSRNNRFG